MSHKQMLNAKSGKRNEFFTQFSTIAKELPYYADNLHGKTIYCNCDNPAFSNFWKYLALHFQTFHLQKLIATYYSCDGQVCKTEMFRVSGNRFSVTKTPLHGNGDFRSQECIDILKDADIVITNPPFSLAQEFLELMYQYQKDFLILGNQNLVTCKNIYPHLLDGTFFFGVSIHKGDVTFEIPEHYELIGNSREQHGKRYAKVAGIRWLTNIEHSHYPDMMILHSKNWNLKHHSGLQKKLQTRYGTVSHYPVYDNYPNAIEVPVTEAIPSDYHGICGVPITFLDKYNPKQFKLVGFRKGLDGKDLCICGKPLFFRLLVQRREESIS